MERLGHMSQEISRWRNPISKTTDWNAIAFYLLPIAYVAYPPAAFEPFEQDLREKVEIAI